MEPLYNLFHLSFGEKVILRLRRHWFVFFKKSLIFIGEAVLPIIIYTVIVNFAPNLLINQPTGIFVIMGISIYMLFIWVIYFNSWINYYLDLWLITNKQIVDVNQVDIFNREVSKAPLFRIQDVMAECKGFLPTLLDFGNVYIQTAGTEEKFILKQIPHPFEVANKINDLIKYTPKQVFVRK